MSNISDRLFNGLDFKAIGNNPDFKEDSVRERIILPILMELGYSQDNIIRSKTLQHPFLKVGSGKKIPIKLIPDYLLKVGDCYAWVLDAKAPNQSVASDDNVGQAYSYAMHPEINASYFALCNGLEFALYRTSRVQTPILFFNVEEIDRNIEALKALVAPSSFKTGKEIAYFIGLESKEFDYKTRPLLQEIPVKKQMAKRHFGVHGYFTRQSWNIVAEYIKNFSKPGDLVLDPFGGSGVTAIEAMMNGRKAINIDLNPLAVFIVQALVAPVNRTELYEAYEAIKKEYLKKAPKNDDDVAKALKTYKLPKKLSLPRNSDVETTDRLFSDKQTAELSLLKSIIKKHKNIGVKNALMLAFSSSLNKHNLTFHYTKSSGGGDSGAFRYYRYRIAPNPGNMPLMNIFETKYKKISAAKKEMEYFINDKTIKDIKIIKGSATNLDFLPNESVDYIYTDPPYGNKIPYLDLSAMWNAWLDLDVSEEDYQLEAIEGGEHNKTKDEYNDLISQSISEMYRVLKFDRWLSFVFAHKDPEFWHLIINTAESCGFEYIGAVPQKNGQTSFKKRQNPFTVLSGQLIINFRKTRNPRAIMRANLGMNIDAIVTQTIEGVIAKNNGATLEQINDELIIKGLELGFLDLLKKQYVDLTPVLSDRFDYDESAQKFLIKKNVKFMTNIDVRLRIQYYLISFLRRMERENKDAHFDDIVLEIMPLLKNGITPEEQTILSVLESIADRTEGDLWRLKRKGQGSFDLI
ncbi:MAG: type I restriction enzyme HsdR N-terminal domain-containing protein [Helicobacteraceae bacterium]|jgi:16S rRNA G966 N2-methylase RsmD|nr:type I restriction enzyme HsdR N-terminal domain-containing protein [Helicobacteraceae bacterium]